MVIADKNPFLPLGGLLVQAHQVTRDEYSAYLDSLSGEARDHATPLRDWKSTPGDEPVRWTRFDQATAFCASIEARLPTLAEWRRASGRQWGIDPTGNRMGPLREWTSERNGKFIRIAGASANVNARQRTAALSENYQLATAAAFPADSRVDADSVSSKEVGIRCVK